MMRALLVALLALGCNADTRPAPALAPGLASAPDSGSASAPDSGAASAPVVAPDPAPDPAVGPSVPCPELAPGQAMTPDQCTCRGGRLNASHGGGEQAHCARGEAELGTVRFGIDGGWCCKGQ